MQQGAIVWGAAVAIHYGIMWPIFLAVRSVRSEIGSFALHGGAACAIAARRGGLAARMMPLLRVNMARTGWSSAQSRWEVGSALYD